MERSYEKVLRGEKGMRIMLRDVHGRTKGHYMDGKYDTEAQPGRNLTLGLDYATQELAERLLEGKYGAIVAIEPATGEIIAMASAPTYDPRSMVGRDRGKAMTAMMRDERRPLLNRAISALSAGSTFKISQALLGLQEGSITPSVAFPAPEASTTRVCTWAVTVTRRRSIWYRPSGHRATRISAGICCACSATAGSTAACKTR